mmetsp:Transcript_39648/g.73037  ORF Transcript_39648/g.73037 Transcript_39648/m.73037 type:complete len:1251 (+) Transcript_39648:78-3830(+)
MSSRQLAKAIVRQGSLRSTPSRASVRRALSTVPIDDDRKSWVPRDERVLMDTTRQAIVYQLSKVQVAVAEGIVPWFTAMMPASYFRQVNMSDQITHMRSLSAQFNPESNDFNQAGRGRVVLQSLNASGDLEVTYMDFTGNAQGLLASQFQELDAGPRMGNLSRVKVFTSIDGKLAFNIFTFQAVPLAEGEEAEAGGVTAEKAGVESPGSGAGSIGEGFAASEPRIQEYAHLLKAAHDQGNPLSVDPGVEWSERFQDDQLEQFAQRCSPEFMKTVGPRSFLQLKLLYDNVVGTEDLAVHIEPANLDVSEAGLVGTRWMGEAGQDYDIGSKIKNGWWVKLALTNSVPLTALKKVLMLFKQRGLDVERMHLDNVEGNNPGTTDSVIMARILVKKEFAEGADAAVEEKFFRSTAAEVKRLKWLDDSALELSYRALDGRQQQTEDAPPHEEGWNEVGVLRAEVITCLSSVLHSLLSAQDVWAFSKTNINAVVQHPRYLRLAAGVADLLIARFDPGHPLTDSRYAAWRQALRDEIDNDVQEDPVAKEVLHRMVSVLDATRRTNLFLEDRYALSLRLEASSLFAPGHFDVPYSEELHPDFDFHAQKNSSQVVNEEEASFRDQCAADHDGGNGNGGSAVADTPYGVFFVHGRRFNGFHVRFRDIARGGMRLVTPSSVEQLAIESARHYAEAYNLASAQQMKNKDIPEGGSKCVVLIDSCSLPSAAHRELVMRKSVKAFTDSMLDLIVSTPTTEAGVVDYLKKEELVYLGPDEQVIPDDINWIVSRAAQRGYPIPSAFMSSKPEQGINHKTYGVTSEGVQVFLDVALREMQMHPDQQKAAGAPDPSFTVKMTGGPDGDVAGNMIKILQREYGSDCRVVGLADATGCAEDPNGLDPAELMRLVVNELPIAAFDRSKLSKPASPSSSSSGNDDTDEDGKCWKASLGEGKLYVVDPKLNSSASAAEEALRARNTMHNRIPADAFIPAGGRPATIHEGNWRQYLKPDGTPSSKLIVEGANLFLTPAARDAMHAETGIPIVKDSSANKCGVICSSFEIMSSMLLSDTEFAAVKPELVEDVLVRLRLLAKREAELLFREFRTLPGSLPDFSQRISLAINRCTDAIALELDNLPDDSEAYANMLPLVSQHMPEKLTDMAGHRLRERVPKEYLKRAIASTLASQIVYKEGVQFVEQHRDKHLGSLAFNYLEAEAAVGKVLETLDEAWANTPDGVSKEGAAESAALAREIVADGGVRAYLARHGGLAK